MATFFTFLCIACVLMVMGTDTFKHTQKIANAAKQQKTLWFIQVFVQLCLKTHCPILWRERPFDWY